MIAATLVSAGDCHLCARAKELLTKLGGGSLELTELEWDSPAGQALISAEGIPFAPAVFLNGEFLAYGRISEGALRRRLESLG